MELRPCCRSWHKEDNDTQPCFPVSGRLCTRENGAGEPIMPAIDCGLGLNELPARRPALHRPRESGSGTGLLPADGRARQGRGPSAVNAQTSSSNRPSGSRSDSLAARASRTRLRACGRKNGKGSARAASWLPLVRLEAYAKRQSRRRGAGGACRP